MGAAPMCVDRWLGWAGCLALGYGGVCLLMFLTQRSFIYFPRPAADPSCKLELQVEASACWWPIAPIRGPGLIYFGGNAEPTRVRQLQRQRLVVTTLNGYPILLLE